MPPLQDILMNTCKWETLKVYIQHPLNSSLEIEAVYEGETLNGVPHGFG
jgi:hypothetical protein